MSKRCIGRSWQTGERGGGGGTAKIKIKGGRVALGNTTQCNIRISDRDPGQKKQIDEKQRNSITPVFGSGGEEE